MPRSAASLRQSEANPSDIGRGVCGSLRFVTVVVNPTPAPRDGAESAGSLLVIGDHQRRQRVDDLHRLDADRGYPSEEVQDVARVADLLRPVVGVVDDAGRLVGLDPVTVDDPLDGRPGSELVAVRLLRDARQGDPVVVVDERPVVSLPAAFCSAVALLNVIFLAAGSNLLDRPLLPPGCPLVAPGCPRFPRSGMRTSGADVGCTWNDRVHRGRASHNDTDNRAREAPQASRCGPKCAWPPQAVGGQGANLSIRL